MPFNFPDYSRKAREKHKWKCSTVSLMPPLPLCVLNEPPSLNLYEMKSLSFETDAVVLLPLFMKCLFCVFNEIFNEKVFIWNGKKLNRKHAKSNSAQKSTSELFSHTTTTMACEALFCTLRKTIFRIKSSHRKSFPFFVENN